VMNWGWLCFFRWSCDICCDICCVLFIHGVGCTGWSGWWRFLLIY
jgi:hypothetical protein